MKPLCTLLAALIVRPSARVPQPKVRAAAEIEPLLRARASRCVRRVRAALLAGRGQRALAAGAVTMHLKLHQLSALRDAHYYLQIFWRALCFGCYAALL